jgi:hypothetical protein
MLAAASSIGPAGHEAADLEAHLGDDLALVDEDDPAL